MKKSFTHFTKSGDAQMVDIYGKDITERMAVASGKIYMSNASIEMVRDGTHKKGDVLARHKDRYSCEISTTMNLGGDEWSIYVEPDIEINLKPGDMLMYRGCDLEHWREPFGGDECAQVFLHYNNKASKDSEKNIFDRRKHIGLPSWFKGRL